MQGRNLWIVNSLLGGVLLLALLVVFIKQRAKAPDVWTHTDLVIEWKSTAQTWTLGHFENLSGRTLRNVKIYADYEAGQNKGGFAQEPKALTTPIVELQTLSHSRGETAETTPILAPSDQGWLTLLANYNQVTKVHATETAPDGSEREIRVESIISPNE